MKNQLLRKISLWNRARLDKRRSAKMPFDRWVRDHDTLSPAITDSLRQHVEQLGIAAPISVILGVGPSDRLKALQATVESIQGQLYPHWELLLVLQEPLEDVSRYVQCLAQGEARVKIVGAAAGTSRVDGLNLAARQAIGSFIAFLSTGGLCRPHALLTLARAIESHPKGRVFYSDEDEIDSRGQRSQPRFKPAWNAYLLKATNYLGQLCTLDTRLVQQVGGLAPDFQHDAAHDLVLRCTERLAPDEVVHIPLILYHGREPGGVDAEAREDSRIAVQRHLQRMGIQGSVTLGATFNQVNLTLPARPPRVSIIIPSRDRPELLKQCVASVLRATAYEDFELLFIDNGTTDERALRIIQELAQDSRFKVLVDASPFNYSRLNNRGASMATGKLLCLLNNDVEITDPQWLSKLVAVCLQNDVGAVGARLLFPSGQIQHAGVILGIGGPAGHPFMFKAGNALTYMDRAMIMHELSAVTGACLLTSKALFNELGGLDEELSVAFNDVDYCLKIRALGQKVIYAPQVELIHNESASRGKDNTLEKRSRLEVEVQYMKRKWPTWLNHDPAYNPNLTLKSDGFTLADPPRIRLLDYLAKPHAHDQPR